MTPAESAEAHKPSESPLESARPRLGEGPFGTAHPMLPQHIAQSGSWFVACQARADTDGDGKVAVEVGHHGALRGDAVRPYFFFTPGEGMPIDDVVAFDPAERFLAVLSERQLALLDTKSGKLQRLDAFVPPPEERYDFLFADFDETGSHVVFLRRDGERRVAVVRSLADGSERVVETPPGDVHVARLLGGGAWVQFMSVVEDTDHDGKVTWPRPRTSQARAACLGPALSYSTWGSTGDEPKRFVAPVGTGKLRAADDVVGTLGSDLIRREEDGGLRVEDASGAGRTWVPASCKPQLLYADAPRHQLLVACQAEGRDAGQRQRLSPAYLYGPDRGQALGFVVSSYLRGVHHANEPAPVRWLGFNPTWTGEGESREPGALLDLESRKVFPLDRGEVVAIEGSRVLLSETEADGRKFHYWLLDLNTGDRRELIAPVAGYAPMFRAGPMAAVGGLVVDVAAGREVGLLPENAEDIDAQGRALVAAEPGRPPQGPMQWVLPKPLNPAAK